MKTDFKFSRLRLLLLDTLRTNFKDTILPVLISLGVILAICVWSLLEHRLSSPSYNNAISYTPFDFMWERESAFFWAGLICLTIYCASRMFSPLRDKASSISYLTLPATNIEKYTSRWLIMIPGCLIIYILGFQLVDLIRCLFALCIFGSNPNIMPIGITPLLAGNWHGTLAAFFTLFIIQSFFALGSSIWPRRSIIFTCLWFLGLSLAMSIWTVTLVGIFALDSMHYTLTPIDLSEKVVLRWYGLFTVIVCIINYTLAYFRFKEAEIIHRW